MIGREKGEEECGEIRYESIRSAKSMGSKAKMETRNWSKKRSKKIREERKEQNEREVEKMQCSDYGTALWHF